MLWENKETSLNIAEINSNFLFQQMLMKMVTMMIILHCCSSDKNAGPAFWSVSKTGV